MSVHFGSGAGTLGDSVARLISKEGLILALLEAYYDESGSHDSSPVFCVSAYIFDADKLPEFNSRWGDVLRAYNLPFFHMIECAHNIDNFKALTKQDCIDVETEMISIIKQFAAAGFAALINPSRFSLVGSLRKDSTHYSVVVDIAAGCVQAWSQSISSGRGNNIHHIFESGHASQGVASRTLDLLTSAWNKKENFGRHAVSFIDKKDAFALQAADLLAWQACTYVKGKLCGRKVRGDFASLAEKRHVLCYFHHIEGDTIAEGDGIPLFLEYDPTPHLVSIPRDEMIIREFSS